MALSASSSRADPSIQPFKALDRDNGIYRFGFTIQMGLLVD